MYTYKREALPSESILKQQPDIINLKQLYDFYACPALFFA